MSDQFDLSALLQQAQAMQSQIMEAQAAAAEEVVVGQSGGGVVKVEARGTGEFVAVTIDPSCVDPADVEMLQDLVLAALHDVTTQLQDISQEAMGGLGGGLGGLLGG